MTMYTILEQLLRDPVAEQAFIRKPRVELDGRSLLEILHHTDIRSAILACEFVEEYANRTGP